MRIQIEILWATWSHSARVAGVSATTRGHPFSLPRHCLPQPPWWSRGPPLTPLGLACAWTSGLVGGHHQDPGLLRGNELQGQGQWDGKGGILHQGKQVALEGPVGDRRPWGETPDPGSCLPLSLPLGKKGQWSSRYSICRWLEGRGRMSACMGRRGLRSRAGRWEHRAPGPRLAAPLPGRGCELGQGRPGGEAEAGGVPCSPHCFQKRRMQNDPFQEPGRPGAPCRRPRAGFTRNKAARG